MKLRSLVLFLLGCGSSPAAPVSTPAVANATATSPKPIAPLADLIVGESDVRDASGKVLVPIPKDRSKGFDASYKRNGGPNDLYVVPLEETLRAGRQADRLRIEVAAGTSFRVLFEVLFTARKNERVDWDVRLQGAPERHVVSGPPHPATSTSDLELVIAVKDGMSIKARGGNVAPGCKDTGGEGFAIANRDYAALGACLKKLKALSPDERNVTVAASADTSFETILSTVETARGPDESLFPYVSFGILR